MKGKIVMGLMSLLLVACSQLPVFGAQVFVDCTSGKYSVPDSVSTDRELRGEPELGYITIASDGVTCESFGFYKHPKKVTILGNEVSIEKESLGVMDAKCAKTYTESDHVFNNYNATKNDKYIAAIKYCSSE